MKKANFWGIYSPVANTKAAIACVCIFMYINTCIFHKMFPVFDSAKKKNTLPCC